MKHKEIILAIYLALAPVYWAPFISINAVSFTKAALIISTAILVWLPATLNGRAILPRGFWGSGGPYLLIILSFFGIFQSEPNNAMRHFQEIVVGFAALWTGFAFRKSGASLERISALTLLLFSPAAILTILAGITGWPSWTNPFLKDPFTLANTGLGGVRTGWSIAIAFLFAFALPSEARGNPFWPRKIKPMIFPAVIILLIGNQIVVGGRSGILASFLVLLLTLGATKFQNYIWVAILSIASIINIDFEWIFHHLRLDRLSGETALDFSAGRTELNDAALNLIYDNFLFGIGAGDIYNSSIKTSGDVHNLWLRLALEYGIVLPCAFFIGILSLTIRASASLSKAELHSATHSNAQTLLSLLTAGLVVSMFEPKVLIGTFQISAIWWLGLGLCLGQDRKPKTMKSADKQ